MDAHFLDGKKHGAACFLENVYSEYLDLESDHEIFFGLERDAPINKDLFNRSNVHIVRYKFGGWLRYLLDIPYITKKNKIDVIHTQYVLPLVLSKSIKRHVTIHDVLYEDYPELFNFIYKFSRRIIFGLSARYADAISTVSNYSRLRLIANYNLDAKHIYVIHNGAKSPEVSLLKKKKRCGNFGNYLIYVSRFEQRKNHMRLLEVLLRLRSDFPDLGLILVGFDVDGTLAKVMQFINKNNLSSHVNILSGITDEYLSDLIVYASVVVYPSLCEGFGMPIIESFLLNPRTAFSNTTAMSDFTFALNNMFDPYDLVNIEEVVRRLLIDDELGGVWAKQKKFIIKHYNWKSSATKLASLHNELFYS